MCFDLLVVIHVERQRKAREHFIAYGLMLTGLALDLLLDLTCKQCIDFC